MNKNNVQAYLILGSKDQSIAYVQHFLKKKLCCEDCAGCNVCIRIRERQHYRLLWIIPEKNYTRELLEPVFQRLSFAGDPEHPIFVVLEDVDFLTPSVGNSLLKSLEEPPVGYVFFLLARAQEFVMPTITSRCVINNCNQKSEEEVFVQLIDMFCRPSNASYMRLAKELDGMSKRERDIPTILDAIYTYWAKEVSMALKDQKMTRAMQARSICEILEKNMRYLPVSGSIKLFFRTLFMQLKIAERASLAEKNKS